MRRPLWLLALVAGALPVVLSACTRTPPPPPAPPVADVRVLRRGLTAQERDAYVGDAACQPCHSEIADGHARSHHARTLLPVDPNIHGPYFAKKQPLKDTSRGYTYDTKFEGGQCLMRLESAAETGELAADFVIGAGHSAHTYFSIVDPGSWMDLRITYYPKAGKWDFTPGQRPENAVPYSPGKLQVGEKLINCLLCHATAIESRGGAPNLARSLFGVGCERCHGSGKAHIDAVNAGDMAAAKAALENLKTATPARLTTLCGYCHQNSEIAKPGVEHTEKDLPRFQAAAMERSACYLKGKTLSCVTCHDPHKDTDNQVKNDEAVCVKCHAAPSKVCPVNPTTDCVRCHMPKQAIPGIPYTRFTNHWIKVWKR